MFEISIMIRVTVFGFVAQYCFFLSTSIIKPSKIMPFGYVTILLGFIGDIYFFEYKFTPLPIVGMLLTSSGLLGDYIVVRFIK